MKHGIGRSGLAGLIAVLVRAVVMPVSADVVYVDVSAGGLNNGTSWTHAYTNLEAALDGGADDEIWIAEGTYVPNVFSDRFNVDNHDMYGGFEAGVDADLADRDPADHPVILSGNMGNGVARIMYKSYSGHTILDGLTFADGYNSGSGEDGAALLVTKGAVTINNCIFTNNAVEDLGGAIAFRATDVTDVIISNCTFTGNRNNISSPNDGGAIYAIGTMDSLTIVQSTFENNTSQDDGGDIYVSTLSDALVIRDCVFRNSRAEGEVSDGGGGSIYSANTGTNHIEGCTFIGTSTTGADDDGGGALYIDGGHVVIRDCTFSNTTAIGATADGGAIFIDDFTAPVLITNTTVYGATCGDGSSSAAYGGGIFIDSRADDVRIVDTSVSYCTSGGRGGGLYTDSASPDSLRVLDRCSFIGNTVLYATSDGGGVHLTDAGPGSRVVNTVFAGNSLQDNTDARGGGMYLQGGGCAFVHCTFYSNTANYGGGMYVQGSASQVASLTNMLFYGNVSEHATPGGKEEFYAESGAVTDSRNCNLAVARSTGMDVATGNVDLTPGWVDAANFDFNLTAGSDMVDAGVTLADVRVDRDGNPRPDRTGSDIGAYELVTPPPSGALFIFR